MEYYLIFRDERIIDLFVEAMDKLILLRYTDAGIMIDCYEGPILPLRKECVQELIGFKVNKRKRFRWFPIWTNSCVEMVRRVSGINLPWYILTPNQLRKALLRQNGLTNFEITSHWSNDNATTQTTESLCGTTSSERSDHCSEEETGL